MHIYRLSPHCPNAICERPTVREDRPCSKNAIERLHFRTDQHASITCTVSWCDTRQTMSNPIHFANVCGILGPVRGHMVQGFRQLGFTHLELLQKSLLEICRGTFGLPVWYSRFELFRAFKSSCLPYLFILAFFHILSPSFF